MGIKVIYFEYINNIILNKSTSSAITAKTTINRLKKDAQDVKRENEQPVATVDKDEEKKEKKEKKDKDKKDKKDKPVTKETKPAKK